MPRRDDVYYRARPGLLLTSKHRYLLSRPQWAAYLDLLNLLYLNGGMVSANRIYLKAQLLTEDSDLDAVLGVDHLYRDGENIRHRVIDLEMADLDQAREWGAEMGRRSAARRKKTASHERTVERDVERTVERKGQRDAGHPQSVRQSVNDCLTDVRQSAGRDVPALEAPDVSPAGGGSEPRRNRGARSNPVGEESPPPTGMPESALKLLHPDLRPRRRR